MARRSNQTVTLGLSWDRLVELILIVCGVMFTGYQVWSAAWAVAKQAEFDSLRESYISLTEGQSEFKTTLYEVRNALPVDVEEVERVTRMDRNQLESVRDVVGPIVAAKVGYEGTVYANIPLWPREIRTWILARYGHGMKVAECYEAAAMRALNDKEMEEIKIGLNRRCRNLGTEMKRFQEDDEALNAAMAQHLRLIAEDLGAADQELTRAIEEGMRPAPG